MKAVAFYSFFVISWSFALNHAHLAITKYVAESDVRIVNSEVLFESYTSHGNELYRTDLMSDGMI